MNKDTMETKTDWAEEEAACAAAPEEPMEEELAETGGERRAAEKVETAVDTVERQQKGPDHHHHRGGVPRAGPAAARLQQRRDRPSWAATRPRLPSMRDITVSVTGTGTVQPIHSSTIVAMVTGGHSQRQL